MFVHCLPIYQRDICLNAKDFVCVAQENVQNFRIIFSKSTKKREEGGWIVRSDY